MWIVDGLANALRMAWEVWWALVLGFALSAIVQAWVPRRRLEHALGGRGPREIALATGLGAASSSCSYAAVAIAKSLFEKGASLASAMTFQFASTNLVFELGIVLWLLIGWRFTLAELAGGLVLIVLLWGALRLLVSRQSEEQVRAHAVSRDAGHRHHSASSAEQPLRRQVTSLQAWSDVGHNFRGDWQMLWKEIGAGLVIAGYVATLSKGFFNELFLTHAWAPVRIAENVLVGPVVAALAFVCSIGNVPLAAVLWAGGSSFAGVIAFLYADLIVVPIVSIYRKVYGGRTAAVLVAAMYGAMVLAALAIEGLFSALGLVPAHRPSVASITGQPVTWGSTTVLDVLFGLVFVTLFALTYRRGAKDPVCAMTVDRLVGGPTSTYGGRTVYFCSTHCKHTFDANPEAYT